MNMKNVLRWIAVPFVYVLAMFIGNIIGNILSWIWASYDGYLSNFDVLSRTIIPALVSGYASIYYGTKTAPNYRKIVSIVLATLHSVIGLFSIIVFATQRNWLELVSVIISIITAIVVAAMIYRGEMKDEM